MLVYILKSGACMAIFFAFYKLLLEKENMHVFKRFYLLLAIATSLLIPALIFTEYVLVEPAPYTEVQEPISTNYDYIGVPPALENEVLDIEPILWTVYLLGLLFFGSKFVRNLFQIIGRIRKNPQQKSSQFIQVLLREKFPPHTFFSYIFLNRKKLEANEIPKEVILHEETHARQKHSLDVIFIELLQVIFWFNPLVYLFKKSIKLNHEFLADQAVLNKDIDQNTYQNTLLSYLSPESKNTYQSKLVNAINYSSIKKRFTVMKKNTSKKAILLRSMLLLPVLSLMLLGFSETKLIEISPQNRTEIQNKVSLQELVRYDKLAKKYNAIPIEKRKIPLSDLKILEALFKKMNGEQKANSQPFPEYLPQDEGGKKFILNINNSKIELNGKQVGLASFTEEVDTITESWEETDYTNVSTIVDFSATPKTFLEKVEKEFKKSHFSKANEGSLIFPKAYSAQLKQEGASRKLMAEYNTLAKKYNTMLSKSNSIQIKMKDVKRLEYIYALMSDKQIADAEPFPDFPEPPPPPSAPRLNDEEFAEKVVGDIIANQDPYDHLSHQLVIDSKGEVSKIPTSFYAEASRIKKRKKIEQKDWVVSSGANRNSRQDHEAMPLPPVAPTIAIHANKDSYSEELNASIKRYLDKNKTYEEAISIYSKKGIGNPKELWNSYNEAMKLYVNYYNLAKVEGNFVQPVPPYKKRPGTKSGLPIAQKPPKALKVVISDITPPPNPPEPKSPLDYAIEMAKKDALFYLEGKEITSDKAIDVLKNNKDINMDARASKGKRPVIKLSKEPIVIEH